MRHLLDLGAGGAGALTYFKRQSFVATRANELSGELVGPDLLC